MEVPHSLYRDASGTQVIVALPLAGEVTIGRRLSNDIVLDWDAEVSRVHATLARIAGYWNVARKPVVGDRRSSPTLSGESW